MCWWLRTAQHTYHRVHYGNLVMFFRGRPNAHSQELVAERDELKGEPPCPIKPQTSCFTILQTPYELKAGTGAEQSLLQQVRHVLNLFYVQKCLQTL